MYREHYQTDSGWLTTNDELELPVLFGGGTYGKYMYGGVALDRAGDHRNSGHGNQHYRYSDQYHPEL